MQFVRQYYNHGLPRHQWLHSSREQNIVWVGLDPVRYNGDRRDWARLATSVD